MESLIWTCLLLPTLLAAVSFGLRSRGWTLALPVVAAAGLLGCGIALVVAVPGGAVTAAGGLLRVDALSAWMLTVVGAVALVSSWAGMPRAVRDAANTGTFAALLCLFQAAMTLALVADNLGILWVAIELTTITTAFLVASRGTRDSLEAAWKYVILGAVGVAIAFLGVALMSAASLPLGEPTVSWVVLMAHAGQLDPTWVKVAGALAVLGFATKAGLAPMHSWLPDAHSQAPAPVSGLMSGVLLSVAFYAILRVQAITDAAIGPELMRWLLLSAGLLSLAVTAGLVITQRDYKRLLAYSSIEHMGLLALGAAIGGRLAIAAVLLHILGHGLIKATMFVVAGRILSATGSHRIADVQHLLRQRRDLAVPFLVGAAGLLGFPPFVTFFTEVAILIAGFQAGLGWQMGVAVVLLLVIFAGITRQVLVMTLGESGGEPLRPGRVGRRQQIPVGLALGSAAVIGFAAGPLSGPLLAAVAALGGLG